jgi:serine/threonine-protein kinase HipA
MTSEREAFVWVWLPGATEPVVAGRLDAHGVLVSFNYGRSYLAREDAMPLYLPELPLAAGAIQPRGALTIAGCIDDAGPDAWGMRVIMDRLLGRSAHDADPAEIDPLAYLLHSGSDRVGALDFQRSPTEYVPRESPASLEDLLDAADHVDRRQALPVQLRDALLHGSSIGGARPKALVEGGTSKLIVKFSSSSDVYPVVEGEYIAMELARRVGMDVAPVRLERVLGRSVLLIDRFDRERTEQGWARRIIISALTMLELHELQARHATYYDLAEIIRARFAAPKATLRELFQRIVFSVLVGNTDDHARNHAAFWDGTQLRMTPAFDICPQLRSGRESNQAMAIGPGMRASQLVACVASAHIYGLTTPEAREVIDHQVDVIVKEWGDVCDHAELATVDRRAFWGRQFLNAYAFEGHGPSPAADT